jgi:DNA-binding transcriptional ArsR family regulator
MVLRSSRDGRLGVANGGTRMGQIAWDRRCLLLTNHALVLAVVAAEPKIRVKEIAERVEVSERAVESLLRDLTDVGFVSRRRVGRRNVYEVHEHMPLRHPLVEHACVGDLLEGLAPRARAETPEASFGGSGGAPTFAENIVACTGDGDAAMVRSHMSSTTKGVMMKRTLVSAIIASLLVFVSAGAAATYGVHYARSHGSTCPAGAVAGTTPDAAPGGVRAGTPRSTASDDRHHQAVRRAVGTGQTTTTVRTPAGTGGVTQTPSGGSAGVGVQVGVAGASVNVGSGGRGTTVDVHAGVEPPTLRDILHLPDGLLGGIGG